MLDVESTMDIADPLSLFARADRAEERGDERGARFWRGLGEALLSNEPARRAFASCRSLRDVMRQRARDRGGRPHTYGARRAAQFRATLAQQALLTDGVFLVRVTAREQERLLKGTALRAAEEARPVPALELLGRAAAGAEVFPER